MGIEFLRQPPQEVGDIKLDFPFEHTPSKHEEGGIDLVWAQIGAADASEVFVNMVEHLKEGDYFKAFDYDLLRLILNDAANVLEGMVRDSYLKGVNDYLDSLKQSEP